MITIQLSGANASEIQKHVTELSSLFAGAKTAKVEIATPEIPVNTESPRSRMSSAAVSKNAPSAEEKRGRGRPARKESVAPKVTKAATPIQPLPAPETAPSKEATPQVTSNGPSKEQAVAALTQIINKFGTEKGIPLTRSALQKFGAQRISEVKPESYGDLIEACKIIENTQAQG